MSPVLYDLSVPVYIRALEHLINILRKGEEHAKENGYEVDTLAQASLGHGMNVRHLLNPIQTAKNRQWQGENQC